VFALPQNVKVIRILEVCGVKTRKLYFWSFKKYIICRRNVIFSMCRNTETENITTVGVTDWKCEEAKKCLELCFRVVREHIE